MSESEQTLETLLEVGRLLSSKLELSELLKSVLELAARVVRSETASLLLVDEKTGELYFDVALDVGDSAGRVRLKRGQGIAGAVAESRRGEIIDDVRKDPRWSPSMDEATGFTTRSVLAVPMTLKGRLVGVLEAINKRDGGFQESDLRALEAFASQAAVAIDNARLFASLKDERFKLATVFSQMTDGAVLTDGSGAVLLANEASGRLLGLEPRELSGGLTGMTVTPALKELLDPEKPAADFTAVRKEPTMLVLEGRVTSAPMAGGAGRLFVFRDRTEAHRQDTLKRTFLSLISHKLRTPLAAVTGFAEILVGELDPEADGMTAKAARTIKEQGQKVSGLVEKLLHYTMLESPDLQVKTEPFALDDAVTEALHALRDSFQAREAQVDAPPTSLIVVADKSLVVEALKNLFDNAVKFNPKPRPTVALRAVGEGDWAAVTVADSGPGIPPEDHERVFSRFHQVEKDFTGQQDGMGLGLAFVRRVAQLHGGEAKLRSKLGEGTSVTLTLPRRRS